MLAYYDFEILKDDQMVMPQQSYFNANKQFYAFAVEGGGPILMVENQTRHAIVGTAFPVKFPERMTRRYVLDEILPICRDYFWHDSAGTSAEDKANGNEMNGKAVAETVPVQILLSAQQSNSRNVYDSRAVEHIFPEANDEVIKIIAHITIFIGN